MKRPNKYHIDYFKLSNYLYSHMLIYLFLSIYLSGCQYVPDFWLVCICVCSWLRAFVCLLFHTLLSLSSFGSGMGSPSFTSKITISHFPMTQSYLPKDIIWSELSVWRNISYGWYQIWIQDLTQCSKCCMICQWTSISSEMNEIPAHQRS